MASKKPSSNKSGGGPKSVEAFRHDGEKRKNIPTAEFDSLLKPEHKKPIELRYPRNTDLDPQLVWRGKDEQDWSDLVVHAPPLYIQEKVHPKALIDDLLRQTNDAKTATKSVPGSKRQLELFSDFNGLPSQDAKTEFYQHDQNWSNRMILGDSLQVMSSLAEREGLRGKVQCIYFDPPYGIKFNSNFQWSTTSRDVKDGKADQITREPEQVKAFRDTWRDGIHSYLTYLRDRFTVARGLLTDCGSIFVQISDENVHRVRAVLDEVFGEDNFLSMIVVRKTGGATKDTLSTVIDFVLSYAKDLTQVKYRQLLLPKTPGEEGGSEYSQVELDSGEQRALCAEDFDTKGALLSGRRIFATDSAISEGFRQNTSVPFSWNGITVDPGQTKNWKTTLDGMNRLARASRLMNRHGVRIYKRFIEDFPVININNIWMDVRGALDRVYVVQTSSTVVQRCIQMATDPGDLVLDPTCGSGTTATVAEQWGRRWITIDSSRVALALARARIMGARYPYYLLADSRDGRAKEADLSGIPAKSGPVFEDIRHGFVYERVPHITLKSIANNAEIDVIWEQWQQTLEPLREKLNAALGKSWQEWEIPREADPKWPDSTKKLHADWWSARIARQREIDASIARKADIEVLYDKPYEDKKKVRVAGPFTVESLSPHRMLGVDENDELIDFVSDDRRAYAAKRSFPEMILENLKTAGVQQARKEGKIDFVSVAPWPGKYVCAEGQYLEGETTKRAAIFIGPEFGTVRRDDLVVAAREASDAAFDVLIACAFNYEAHTTEFNSLGRLPVLKARMNADLHMAEDLKNTGKGNLFVIFGEPDITILNEKGSQIRVKVNGVDVFKPQTGEVESAGPEDIACWFIDTDYNEESFFVRHAYFLGANDPYTALKTTLKAEIDEDAWASLKSDTSRPFERPAGGRIAVKVINHLGDEVMKVFRV